MVRSSLISGLCSETWLPRWRTRIHPARSNARIASRQSRQEAGPSPNRRNLYFGDLHGQWHTELSAALQAEFNCFADVGERLLVGSALSYTSGEGRTLSNNEPVFTLLERHNEFHRSMIAPRRSQFQPSECDALQ